MVVIVTVEVNSKASAGGWELPVLTPQPIVGPGVLLEGGGGGGGRKKERRGKGKQGRKNREGEMSVLRSMQTSFTKYLISIRIHEGDIYDLYLMQENIDLRGREW